MDERTLGREPLQIVEIDEDFCSLSYGKSPCAAVLGVTGEIKCFNRYRHCQDRANFTKSTLTVRFSHKQTSLPKGMTIFPALVSVTTNPTELNIGAADKKSGPLGKRASVTVKFKDFPYHDRLTDKYAEERKTGAAGGEPYDPFKRGTFFAKWKARNPYYQGRALRVREGYVGQPLAEMRTRHYVIERFIGPDSQGNVSIVAKDLLQLADDDRAVAPSPSEGEISRDIADDEVAPTFTLLPAGVGATYPASGKATLGKELVFYTRSGDTITITQRGLRYTEIDSHDEGARFQQVLSYDNVPIVDVLYDLLVNYGNVPPAFIPLADWQQEAFVWLAGWRLSRDICEPTGVTTLLGQLSELGPALWWDERKQLIRFRANRPPMPGQDVVYQISDRYSILEGSASTTEMPDQRITQAWIYYGQINPTEAVDDRWNYRQWEWRPELSAESELEYGDQRIKRIYAPWINAGNRAEVVATRERIIARYRDTPKKIKVRVDAKDREMWTGDVCELTTAVDVDPTGAPIRGSRWQVVSAEEVAHGHTVEYVLQSFPWSGRFAFFTADDAPSYSAAAPEQRESGAWFAPSADGFADGTAPYTFI